MKKFYEQALALQEETIKHRRAIHKIAEVGFALEKTVAYVTSVLDEYQVEYEVICEGGVVANIGNKKGKTILLRADMDALPMVEESGLDFASNHAAAHTCGHDLHTAMLLVTAKLLKRMEHELSGNVKLMFQPDEEGLRGAQAMIDNGLLENPKVDAAMAMHVFPSELETGVFLYKHHAFAAGASRFRIDIQGKGGHGARPEETIDPLLIATYIYQGLMSIQTRQLGGIEPFVLTIGKLAGGDAPNIIPDKATMEGSMRFFSNEVGTFAFERIEAIATQTAALYGGSITFTNLGTCPPVINDEKLLNDVVGYIDRELGSKHLLEINTLNMGSEDFSLVMNEVPGVYLGISAGSKANGYEYFVHHPKVTFDETLFPYGIAAFMSCAANWLEENK